MESATVRGLAVAVALGLIAYAAARSRAALAAPADDGAGESDAPTWGDALGETADRWRDDATALYYETTGAFPDTETDMQSPDARRAAFLAMIRAGEGTAGATGYRTLFGGALFTGYADHPRQFITRTVAGKPLTSSAAGAYQILAKTWDTLARRLGLPDFSPASQDRAALELIRETGALADIDAGRIPEAIAKVRRIWASLPGAGYGQPERSMGQALAAYERALGALA